MTPPVFDIRPLPPISLQDLARPNAASAARTPGVHATDVIRVMMERLDPKRWSRYGQPGETEEERIQRENWLETGFLWEEMLSHALAARAPDDGTIRVRPGEIVHDGLILTPDMWYFDPQIADITAPPAIEEYKATWKSSRNFDLLDKKFLHWTLQMQLYCYATGTTQAYLYVLHVNGSYDKAGFLPQVSGWGLTFPQRVLEDQWRSAINTAKMKGWL